MVDLFFRTGGPPGPEYTDIDLELAILLEDFLERPDLDPVYERIILDKLPPDFDNIYVEFRDGRSMLLTPKQVKHWPDIYEEG